MRGDCMKLSTKGRYGLRALIDLAVYSGDETVSIASIASRQNISESYLEQLIAKLRKAGLVTSVRGAGGGYKLAKPAEEISVECPGLKEESTCDSSDFCVTKYVWQKINDSINQTVDGISLSRLVEESRNVGNKAGSAVSSCCTN